MKFPKGVNQELLEKLVCDYLDGFLLILTPAGKIVFVSTTVETLLGHQQVSYYLLLFILKSIIILL